MQQVLWEPSVERAQASQMFKFLQHVKKNRSSGIMNYQDLHRWSVENSSEFWSELSKWYEVNWEGELTPANEDSSFETYGWFSGMKLNFAQNLLKQGKDQDVALLCLHESEKKREVTYGDLRDQVGRLAGNLKSTLGTNDVLACYMPNIPETTIAMLAATSLGAAFTSTSCDFGVEGVLDRFTQSRPKVLVAAAGYTYNGKYFDLTEKISQIEKRLPFLEKIIIVDFLKKNPDLSMIEKAIRFEDCLKQAGALEFVPVPFSQPLYIMYSSGTTGKPKCIVHSVGGTLFQHIKELGLHSDLTQEKRIMYFTTCGWMMWNWQMSSLYFGCTVVLYEGSPGFPSLEKFVEIIDKEKINIYGTSPKFLKALEDSKLEFKTGFPHMETMLSTGAPLLPEQYDFVYQKMKKDILLSSIAGGTDIIGCFMLGNPLLPVTRGEIQCLGLGMDVACYDDQGKAVAGQEGELVCQQSFPSRPLYFLSDESGERIRSAYFDRFPGVWHHGDFISISKEGTVMVYGRSDATLNPGGVRIGTAEIYRQTEQLDYLEDSLCVGRPKDGDVEVVLFVKMKSGEELNDERVKEIKTTIRKKTTPRHVPGSIYGVSDIPYTRSGKKMELAISRILAKRELTNIEAVANPECLKEYEVYS